MVIYILLRSFLRSRHQIRYKNARTLQQQSDVCSSESLTNIDTLAAAMMPHESHISLRSWWVRAYLICSFRSGLHCIVSLWDIRFTNSCQLFRCDADSCCKPSCRHFGHKWAYLMWFVTSASPMNEPNVWIETICVWIELNWAASSLFIPHSDDVVFFDDGKKLLVLHTLRCRFGCHILGGPHCLSGFFCPLFCDRTRNRNDSEAIGEEKKKINFDLLHHWVDVRVCGLRWFCAFIVFFLIFVVEISARASHPQRRIYCRDQHDKKQKKKKNEKRTHAVQAERKWSLKFLPFWTDSNFTQVQSRTLLTANLVPYKYTKRSLDAHRHARTWTNGTFDEVFGWIFWVEIVHRIRKLLKKTKTVNHCDAFNDCKEKCVMAASSYERYPKMENDKSNGATATVSENYDKNASEKYSTRLQHVSSEK